MKKIKLIVCGVFICFINVNYILAGEPYSPDFSLSTHIISEPPALPQDYGIELPNQWEYYPPPVSEWQKNPFLPNEPMLMEVCAITSKQIYQYNTKEELISGCYRNDVGLSHFILQPYQYWSMLSTLKGANLVLQSAILSPNQTISPKIVIFYRNINQPKFYYTSIELGDFYNESSVIVINEKIFQYNIDVMRAFYSLVYEIQQEAYMPENN